MLKYLYWFALYCIVLQSMFVYRSLSCWVAGRVCSMRGDWCQASEHFLLVTLTDRTLCMHSVKTNLLSRRQVGQYFLTLSLIVGLRSLPQLGILLLGTKCHSSSSFTSAMSKDLKLIHEISLSQQHLLVQVCQSLIGMIEHVTDTVCCRLDMYAQ